ncbi:ABC transporter substrate-binding protein [Vallitalea guaymasensis]|uniref:ABC transporter substrate-binding protein n=1 Tax=Vallitalea guaymasensis TaxID=1185412 RepID=A0A8J8M844_9FIRM|nr:ABC transporter substrate-binding protein [Vallitalea guaymasensis]QUH27958.1 ABC transporter substrate-binding protein [Vallitalea guaymasensis]
MKLLKKMSTAVLSIILCITLIAGCSSTKETSNNSKKDITLCESWNFDTGFFTVLSPNNIGSNYGPLNYLCNFYETLVQYEDGEIVPGLADTWEISDDGLTYTFHLKKGVKFSDGEDFNAEAVKLNLDNIPKMLGDFNGAYGATTTLIKEVKAIDEYTVEVNLMSPYYGALQDFTLLLPMGMMSPNAYNEDGTLSDITKTKTLGTGPYMYDGQKDGETYVFIRNKEYNRKQPDVDSFRVKVIPDNDAKILALRSGEIDAIIGSPNISYDSFNELSSNEDYKVKVSDAIVQTRLMGFNLSKKPFEEKAVRLAINHAINKDEISKNLFYGIEEKAEGVLDKSLPYCNVSVEQYDYNKQKANKILEDAGWVDTDGDGFREKDGVKLEGEIVYISGMAMIEDLSLSVAHYLKEIGMDVKVKGMEMMAQFGIIASGDFTMAMQVTNPIPYDPYLFMTRVNPEPLRDNLLAQGLKHIDNASEILNNLTCMTDENKIQETYDFVLKEINKNGAIIPLTNVKSLTVFNKGVIEDYKFFGHPDLPNVANISLK